MNDDFIVLSRDPFARVDFIRMVEETTQGCAWCGNRRKNGKMFYYGTWAENGHTYWHSKPFCSKSCHDIYYAS